MKYTTEDIKLCDMCEKFETTHNGCVEICHARRECDAGAINSMPLNYVEQRLNGAKNHCKEFKRMQTKKELLTYLNA